MLDRKKKLIITFFLLCNLAFLIIFLMDLFCYNGVFYFPLNSPFRNITDLDWELFVQNVEDQYNGIIMLNEIASLTVIVINFIAIQILIFGKYYGYILLPIRKVWKITIPLSGVLLYLPCFYYTKNVPVYFHLYMLLMPAVYLSLIVLALIIVGVKSLKSQSIS